MRWVQIISRKGQWKKISTEILRDYMPDLNRNSGWERYSPNCMATCREWQKCPLPFFAHRWNPQQLKPHTGRLLSARLKPCPDTSLDTNLIDEKRRCNRVSEIPCRVSSDLHEWRNESATVLPT